MDDPQTFRLERLPNLLDLIYLDVEQHDVRTIVPARNRNLIQQHVLHDIQRSDQEGSEP